MAAVIIERFDKEAHGGLVPLLYGKYLAEAETHPHIEPMTPEAYAAFVTDALEGMSVLRMDEGVICYGEYEDEGRRHCFVPPFGYCAASEKAMVRLFQALANEVVRDVPCDFSVSLYAGDTSCLQAMHMMGFGNMSEKCVRAIADLPAAPRCGREIEVLTAEDVEDRWPEIWQMTKQVIDHLKESPVFYPGDEFTEDMYHEFFTDDACEVLTVRENGEPIGMIEWNREGDGLLGGTRTGANVGEAYVSEAYRGTGLARDLLSAAVHRAKAYGAEYMWVEHGTANPNARGFWNKYFETAVYELVRTIVPVGHRGGN